MSRSSSVVAQTILLPFESISSGPVNEEIRDVVVDVCLGPKDLLRFSKVMSVLRLLCLMSIH